MTLLLPAPFVEDTKIQANFETISLKWPSQNQGVFHAYRAAAVALATNAGLIFDTDNVAGAAWDLPGWYNTGNGRYVPQVTGYYRLSWQVMADPGAGKFLIAQLWKNGAVYNFGQIGAQVAGAGASSGGSEQVFAAVNDFFQIIVVHNAGGALAMFAGPQYCWFDGEMLVP